MKTFKQYLESVYTHDLYKPQDSQKDNQELTKSLVVPSRDELNQQILKKLLRGEMIETKNPKDVSGLYIKLQRDSGGNLVGISNLPELKNMKFSYSYINGTYRLQRIPPERTGRKLPGLKHFVNVSHFILACVFIVKIVSRLI